MTIRRQTLTGLLLMVAAACAGREEEPIPVAEDQIALRDQAAAAAPTAGKPLIHVWKSPT